MFKVKKNWAIGLCPHFSMMKLGDWVVCFLWRFALSFRLRPKGWLKAFSWDKHHRVFNMHLGPFGLDYFPPPRRQEE